MATASLQRTYTDLDAAFTFNPITDDIALITNNKAIAFSVKNLILTMNGERPFNPDLGTPIRHLIFEQFGPMLDVVLKQLISQVLATYEPRISVSDIEIDSQTDQHQLSVTIKYTLLSISTPYSINVVLTRTR